MTNCVYMDNAVYNTNSKCSLSFLIGALETVPSGENVSCCKLDVFQSADLRVRNMKCPVFNFEV